MTPLQHFSSLMHSQLLSKSAYNPIKNTPKPYSQQPTTFIDYNFISVFYAKTQDIVNTFGVPRYKEINPAIYCMSMLPFKFGVMFGDIGHGMLLLIAGIFLCRKHATLKPNTQIYNHIIFKARYIIVLLGFFALYSGFIYNNLFSLPIGLFAGSCYNTIEVNF